MPPRKQPRRHEANAEDDVPKRGERLQKVLAAAGVGSRRECEGLITAGRVEVDGKAVSELGVRIDPFQQKIRVDGTAIHRPKRVYFLVNKPPGVVCTSSDPSGRVRVIDLIRTDERLFTIGRLDISSEGLILVTNDGELANRLTHPRYGISKIYRVRVAGQPSAEILGKLRQGIHMAEGFARVVGAKVKRRFRQSTELEITLNEGRNREIRRLLARVGHKVLLLKRIAIGSLRLGDLPLGSYRRVTRDEIRQLEYASRRRGKEAAEPRQEKDATRHKRSGVKKTGGPQVETERKQATTGRKKTTTARKKVATGRKKTATGRDQAAADRKKATTGRKKAVTGRKKGVTKGRSRKRTR